MKLKVTNLTKRFGGLEVLKGVSFEVNGAELIGLIGPNGAGKTTLTNILDGAITPNSGTVYLNDRRIDQLKPYEVARAGLGRTFQNLALFAKLSVLDNVMIGAHPRTTGNFVSDALRLLGVRPRETAIRDEAMALLEELRLDGVANDIVSSLPFGTQKRVELARALASRPTLLMLDEPAGGLNHDEVEEFKDVVRRIRDHRQISVLLVEHHMNLVMSVSDQVVVLNFGRKIAEGTPSEVQQNPEVVEAYLGSGSEVH